MKPHLIIILAVIVLLPLVILGWLGRRVILNEQNAVQARYREVIEGRLRDTTKEISSLLNERERILPVKEVTLGASPETIRELVRKTPLVRQYFILDPQGGLAYPNPQSTLTEEERAFLQRTQHVWETGGIASPTTIPDSQAPQTPAQVQSVQTESATASHGWYVWYWGDGLDLIYWWRGASAEIAGAELNAARLMADVVAILPDTGADALPDGGVVLRDARGEVIYQWGGHSPTPDESPQATMALAWPLSSWTLEHYVAPAYWGAPYGRGLLFNLMLGLGVLALVIIALAVYYYRESAREMREAAQRITFVNQVSHELKTPLTNIRMYAELLDDDLQERLAADDAGPERHLNIIVEESQRLSRLIGNILTFSRKQRKTLALHGKPGRVDEVLATVAAHFEAPLRGKGIGIVFEPGAPDEAWFDADVLEQIVGNLLSNVEKYATGGTSVTIHSTRRDNLVEIRVADDGPGITKREAKRIFEPFYRVSNRLTDGVAGTGIGLSIARDLARLHGGDLVLSPSAKGACFVLTLRVARGPSGEGV